MGFAAPLPRRGKAACFLPVEVAEREGPGLSPPALFLFQQAFGVPELDRRSTTRKPTKRPPLCKASRVGKPSGMATKPKPEPRKGGRQPWSPSESERAKALIMVGFGATQEQLAKIFGVHRTTIAKHLEEEFATGWELANLKLYGMLWERAMGKGPGSIAALIFLCKNRLGMSDNPNGGTGGGGLPEAAPTPREEMCVRVVYRTPTDPRALAPPGPEYFQAVNGKAPGGSK